MDFLPLFLDWAVKNLNEYNQKIETAEGADWRIKEALLFAITCIKDEICSVKDLKAKMEEMLYVFVFPELTSD